MIDAERQTAEARALARENQALRGDALTRARLLRHLIEDRDMWRRRHAQLAQQLESLKSELKASRACAERYRIEASAIAMNWPPRRVSMPSATR